MSEVRLNRWEPICLSNNGPKFSHLFFADDVLLFAKAKVSQARIISGVLNNFSTLSGLKVSLMKSIIRASKGVTSSNKVKISDILQMNFTNNLEKYLGFRLHQDRVTKKDFEDVVSGVESKLASWKVRLLNKPGRMVLANDVINSLPSYGMQIQWYPESICQYLDKVAAHFIWKGVDGKGLHLVSFNKMFRKKKHGGLGVRVARYQNVALLGKNIWELLNSNDKLWVDMLKDIYVQNGNVFSAMNKRGSPTWNSIVRAWKYLESGFEFKVGDGNTSFWHSPWILKDPLCDHVLLWTFMIFIANLKMCGIVLTGIWIDYTRYCP